MSNRDRVYLMNIRESIQRILFYTENITESNFKERIIVQDAVIRNFEIIGEASKNISKRLKSETDQIPWKEMAGMRDKLIHDYMGVDLDILWVTIEDILPDLKEEIKKLIQKQ